MKYFLTIAIVLMLLLCSCDCGSSCNKKKIDESHQTFMSQMGRTIEYRMIDVVDGPKCVIVYHVEGVALSCDWSTGSKIDL